MEHSSQNRYSDFNETDFINDAYFQSWIIRNTPALDLFWNSFLQTYPDKRKTVEAAKELLQNVRFVEEIPDDEYVHQRYLQHMAQVLSDAHPAPADGKVKWMWKIVAVAAFVGAVFLAVRTVFQTQRAVAEKVVVATNFGEIRKVVLPDSSMITLNAHSSITFLNHWDAGKEREIWLDGEAFLDIRHQETNKGKNNAYQKFLVHGQGFTIEVLGTSFDIRQRRGKMEVVLQSGRIKLMLKDKPEPVILVPGDLVTYVPVKKSLKKSTIVPEEYSGWKDKKLLLNNPTLEEITDYLEDNYGKEIVIETPRIRQKKIEGMIELTNLDDALFIISTVLNTEIVKRENHITIKSK